MANRRARVIAATLIGAGILVASGAASANRTGIVRSGGTSGEVAFTAVPKSGPWRIALLRLRSGETSYVTPARRYAEMPSWSPNGRRIAFARSTAGGAQRLVVLNVVTGKQRLLAAGEYLNEWPAWSPNGRRIAFVRSPLSQPVQEIWSIRPSGNGLRLLARHTGLGRPAWSPDGRLIAFGRGRGTTGDRWDLWVMSRNGTNARVLARNGTGPAWAPDGKRIAFGVPNGSGNGCCLRDLYVMRRDGTHRHLLAQRGAAPTWSPDGSAIAFQRLEGHNWNLWTIAPNGSRAQRLTNAAGDETTPAWRP